MATSTTDLSEVTASLPTKTQVIHTVLPLLLSLGVAGAVRLWRDYVLMEPLTNDGRLTTLGAIAAVLLYSTLQVELVYGDVVTSKGRRVAERNTVLCGYMVACLSAVMALTIAVHLYWLGLIAFLLADTVIYLTNRLWKVPPKYFRLRSVALMAAIAFLLPKIIGL